MLLACFRKDALPSLGEFLRIPIGGTSATDSFVGYVRLRRALATLRGCGARGATWRALGEPDRACS